MGKEGKIISWMILLFLGVLLSLMGYVNHKYFITPEQLEIRKAYFQILSISHLASCKDCISTRNLLEGVYGCLSDIPGGYCYHSSCDVVLAPEFPEEEILTLVVKRERSY